ncbi:glycosyltransferase family 9 protein [Selenomonas artemidis]|uniref:glycosyltransferase family 9 protein n=1 Tax=Selenomonas artemidis TaxID=671224 RepID=UPI00288973F6|nr:glycosyltransferase family 9 protein [Selenomonas artemidis]
MAGLFEACPYIDRMLSFDPGVGCKENILRPVYAWRFCRRCLSGVYDIAIVPRRADDYGYGAGYIALFSWAERRIAYASYVDERKRKTDAPFDCFYTELLPAAPYMHEVEWNLNILRFMGIDVNDTRLEFWISAEDEVFVRQWKKKQDTFRIALFLSTSTGRKEWDVKKYAETLRHLEKAFSIEVFLLGAGEHAENLSHEISRIYPRTINLTGKLSLSQTGAFLYQADVYLGGDTGPMHMAAACKLPSVILFCHPQRADIEHVSSPDRFGPWGNEAIVLRPVASPGCEHGCEKEYAHCINNITVDEVVDAVASMLTKIKSSEDVMARLK